MCCRNKLIFIKIAVNNGIVANQIGVAQITDIAFIIVTADSQCRLLAPRLGEKVSDGHVVQSKITHLQHHAVAAGVADLAVVQLHIGPLRHQTIVFVVVDDRIVDNGLISKIFHQRRHLHTRGRIGDDSIVDDVVLRAFIDENPVPLLIVGGVKLLAAIASKQHRIIIRAVHMDVAIAIYPNASAMVDVNFGTRIDSEFA